MLLLKNHNIDQLLIHLLASSSGFTAKNLHTLVNQNNRKCSIQGIYTELKKLQAQGIVVKYKKTYSLDLSWSLELLDFADRVYQQQLVNATFEQILPAKGKSNSWTFNAFTKADDFYMQIMVIMFKHCSDRSYASWAYHPWYYYSQVKKVNRVYEIAKQEKRRLHYIIGGNTYLDRLYMDSLDSEVFEYSWAKPDFPTNNNECFMMNSKYFMSMSLDAKSSRAFNQLFNEINKIDLSSMQEMLKVLHAPVKVKIRLEHKPNKCQKLVREYQKFFGVSSRKW